MNLFGLLGVSGSALAAERARAEITASNMANAETTRTADGKLFQRQHVIFQSIGESGNEATPPGLLGGSFASSLRSQFMNTSRVTSAADVPNEGGVEIAGIVTDH